MRVAVDTNILVRFLVDDGSSEVAKVVQFVEENHIVIVPTVLLETEWVLRFTIGLNRTQIATAFDRLLGLTAATILRRETLTGALQAYRGGCDFADALHQSSTSAAEVFATLDKKFARRASRLGLEPPVLLIT